MTIVNKICDSCGAKVEWLYAMPNLKIEGLGINVYDGGRELCKWCAKKLIDKYRTEKFDMYNIRGVK